MALRSINWIWDLQKLGSKDPADDDVSRRIAFSNIIFFTLPIVYFVFMVIDYESYIQQPISRLRFDQLIVPIEILLCLFCLWLNKKQFTTISRVLFLITWPFFLHIIPIKLLNTPPDYYLAFPFGLVFHAVLIQLMVSHRKEKLAFLTLIALNFTTLIFAGNILEYFVLAENTANPIIYDRYFLLDNILYWLLFNLVMYYTLLVIEHYIRRVNRSNRLIEKQKDELSRLNHGLEKEVSRRTKELELQNKKLLSYSYYNAHMLRGPFCRVKGLIELINMTDDKDEKHGEIMPRISESITELENVIEQIRIIVDAEKKVDED